METEIGLADRIRGGIYGLLIGDALGVPYEFNDAASLPSKSEIEFDPPQYFRRSHSTVPPGTWSDDGAQGLVLLASLLECGCFDIDHFAQGLIAWHDRGYMAIDEIVFDVGIQTRKGINELKSGISPILAGGIDEFSNGNGSLMRCLPLALWHRGTDRELIEFSFAQSAPTHSHPRSKLCCALYCLWTRGVLKGEKQPWEQAIEVLAVNLAHADQLHELEAKILPALSARPTGSGYVVDTLRSALWASHFSDYEDAVKEAICLGDDTDTTACVTGGIAGAMHGYKSIPERWRDGLRGKEIVDPLIDKLLTELGVSD